MAGAFGRLTKSDDLGRQVATVENASGDFDPARDITSQPGANGAPGRWAVDSARLSASDANRVTSYVYDASGNIVRMREVRSTRDAAGTQVDSGVGFTYTPLWQVASVVQHPTGAALAANGTPAAGSRSVSYAYSTVLPSTAATPPAAGDNFSRLSTTTYPTTSTVVTQTYASGVDARLSRVSGLSLNSPNGTRYSLAAYRRLGMDTFAVVDKALSAGFVGRRATRHRGLLRRHRLAVSLRIQRRLAVLPSARRATLWPSTNRRPEPSGGRHPARPDVESIRPEAPHERLDLAGRGRLPGARSLRARHGRARRERGATGSTGTTGLTA
jgi:hypothetical protein